MIAGEVKRGKSIRERGMPGLNTVVMLDCEQAVESRKDEAKKAT